MLSDYEFWKRVKGLVGKTIYTLTRHRPNLIVEVNEYYVYTANRKKPVLFNGEWGIYHSYHVLHRQGHLLVSKNNANAPASFLAMSIILNAVPDECEQAGRGLRLK